MRNSGKCSDTWSICTDRHPQNNEPLVTDYTVERACENDPGVTTLESPLVGAALFLSTTFEDDGHFDLRFLAALHLALLLLGFAILLCLTRRAPPPIRYGIPALYVLIFSDVAYTCYLNSAYRDALSFVSLIALSAIAIAACYKQDSWAVALGYLIASLALVFSKSQHSLLAIFFAALALAMAFRSTTRSCRLSMVCGRAIADRRYGDHAGYQLIGLRTRPPLQRHLRPPGTSFHRPCDRAEGPRPRRTGLGAPENQRILAVGPLSDPLWTEDFLRRTSFGDLIIYYLRHPSVPLREIDFDLSHSSPAIRPPEVHAQPKLWSTLRGAALRVFPYHLYLIYLAPWAVAFAAWKWKIAGLHWPAMPLALALSASGLTEFALSSLTDAVDTARHLFLSDEPRNSWILLIATALLTVMQRTGSK